ncbi:MULTISPECIES: FadR/GntR family transcriptional regulator [Streptomyces]|uniref:FadR/GntR family transcriptional regulator n=1 Tax=Streptomyces evansiae TaxID=3075535 RepID=A0ABD5E328_9ACTN|nr:MULTISPECIES: FadR/GntR family transcriptional regulator [unclassified Streptomyces]SCD96427.1 transcriptional regulator, GntR family [Streptomyces sp. SolWspMP-sol7th]ASY36399.1 GntR family transcriptional regulator [Streptomyces sp. CLI2509]MDT0415478.1 FadR/GntR family transcriptional regulator [Streptomyces sp. DSM 41982]MYX21616.1 GntR family transcriptional regulator [Streptomyces sp. SID8380]NJA60191.1 FadR family transcriptional regulator [Streptomyces sp. NEAU-H3]
MPSRPGSQPKPAPNAKESPAAPAPEGLFKAVSSSRVSQVIVEQIRMLLKEEKLKPGDRLPSERDLCVHFGVSRVTVREALRILEAGGLVEIRVGARGGAFVTTPDSRQVGEGLATLLSLSPLTAAEVTEARLVFELGIVPLIVERATDEDLDELFALCDTHIAAMEEGVYTMEMSAEFHTRVADCTHNAAIRMLVESFHGPLLMSLREAQTVEPRMGKRGSREHRSFVEAVAARDVEKASGVMRTHLERTAARVRSQGA